MANRIDRNKDVANASIQPHLYCVTTSQAETEMISGARYVELDNGSLVICAVNESENKVEYEEIARFSKGHWISIAIVEYFGE